MGLLGRERWRGWDICCRIRRGLGNAVVSFLDLLELEEEREEGVMGNIRRGIGHDFATSGCCFEEIGRTDGYF